MAAKDVLFWCVVEFVHPDVVYEEAKFKLQEKTKIAEWVANNKSLMKKVGKKYQMTNFRFESIASDFLTRNNCDWYSLIAMAAYYQITIQVVMPEKKMFFEFLGKEEPNENLLQIQFFGAHFFHRLLPENYVNVTPFICLESIQTPLKPCNSYTLVEIQNMAMKLEIADGLKKKNNLYEEIKKKCDLCFN